ncbi:hypothetical protein COU18_03450 [Candidatus Kaiserbacteria bacterium CG10_big_fil_rev_8_21_14_0_10_51_14]|uniref:Uncharacterized protein n=1 Tax=Candidatus Kaiserbacteria bacterium CG10_big_fil_rev_8_21_14_0_10_51_14 TaxID=1974610 RepID=A0A2H0UBA1_9BACT|nr:MAG: hypothetical protein COU18_03450 [Candidatus Kaiserbacteria bacterium CG10_big_fil_rev_8_21_14_0_10_51_14]
MKYARIIFVSVPLAVPAIALAAPQTFAGLVNVIVGYINIAIPVLITLGIVIYMYGVSTNILKFGDENREKFKAYFVWGILILFFMVSIWGILRLLQSTFNLPTG